MRKRRHPFRGLFFGLLLGLGAGALTIVYGINVLGGLTPWAAVVAGVVIGLLVALFVPSRRAMRG
jgi:hypothetical protein